MGIYIKGMEMPKNCFECPWRCKVDPENLLCRISGEYFEETFSGTIQNRHKSCPLVPVQPHGRLIDAGELYDKVDAIFTQILGYRDGEDVRSQSFQSGAYYSIQKVKNALSNAPTIIPAEEGET